MSDLVTMQKCDLVGALGSTGQTVGKRSPTRLELLGGVVTLLCDLGRLRLQCFPIFLVLGVMGDEMVPYVRLKQVVGAL